jgi:hypothetical protein
LAHVAGEKYPSVASPKKSAINLIIFCPHLGYRPKRIGRFEVGARVITVTKNTI